MSEITIFAEGHGDAEIFRRFIPDSRPIAHGSSSIVMSKLLASKIPGIIGIIDDDKVKPKGFDEFIQEAKNEKMRFLRHGEKKICLVVISPAIEGFLLDCAKQADIDPGKYKIRNQKGLQRICKSISAAKNQDLLNFINTLKQKNPPPIRTLKSWITSAFK